mmetsp:Transcript_2468/g.2395  ORF Transcript_2468/g.2395 Transcript_2468/m.2395 type:complete len:246 (-) Transcript_2468:1714-2451(-)
MTNMDDIFERIIESLNSSRQNSVSLPCNNEDFVAPILDYTSEVFSNPNIEYNNIHLVCCDVEPPMDPKKVPLRRWSRSRSIVSNSLMNCINKQTSSCHHKSTIPSISDSERCAPMNESCSTLSNTSKEVNDRTGLPQHESHYNSNKMPPCSSGYPSYYEKGNRNSSSDCGIHDNSSNSTHSTDAYIDFYSYADMLNSEIAEGFHNESQSDRVSYVEDLNCGDMSSRFSTISIDDYVNCIVNEKDT